MKRWIAVLSHTGWTLAGMLFVVWLGTSPKFAASAQQRGALLQVGAKTDAKTEPAKVAPAKTLAAKTKTAKRAAKKPPAKNLLQRIIRGVLPAKKPARILPKNNKGGAMAPAKPVAKKTPGQPAGNGDPKARDHIDRRAPFDQDDARRLERAERFIKAKNWKLARILLQRLLDRSEDSLIRSSTGEWVSVRDEATRLLGKFPVDQLDAYQLEFGKPAELLLNSAIEQGDMRKVVDVATRYFRTPAGKRAAGFLASWYLDREEYGMSARWVRRLLDTEAEFTGDPRWMLKAALVFKRAGNAELSERLLKSIEGKVGAAGVNLGGTRHDPREWLNKAVLNRGREGKPLEEWPVFFGTPSRTGTVAGSDPLLLPRWSQPTTYSHTVRRKMQTLIESLSDLGRALVPAFYPLAIDNKIVFRTLRGVAVVDAESGKLLWETREGISPEMIISGRGRTSSSSYSRFNRVRFRSGSSSYGTKGDHDPLTSLLFRNGTYGNISSDGKRLFVIESHAVLSSQRPGYNYGDPEQRDPYRRSWTTNKLAAYDLNTGRPLWEIGGRKRNEPFDLPLAGYYFFSTPVADRGELFLVGEKDRQIRVFAIDAETGTPKWSQLIAYSDAKINRDMGRRWFTAQVAVKDGLLICPTTVGWLVAVDRLNHSVLWAHRYSKTARVAPNRFGSNPSTMVPAMSLNSRWSPSAPVMTGGHVVYTPSEESTICCLKLLDGKQAWKIPKSDYLYLAGVFGERVVLVGRKAVTAVSLTKGTTLWTLELQPADGRPSGMGVAVDGTYHLPLSTGQLWSIDLKNGKPQKKLYLSDPSRPLGNLSMYRGMLLSLGPFGMASFEQRDAIIARIKERKAQSPRDAWALLREVEILHLERDFAASLKLLNQIQPESVAGDMIDRYRKLMLLSLTKVIRSDLRKHDTEVRQLERFVKSAEEKFAFRRLAAERHDARGELEQAFDIYLTLIEDSPGRVLRRADNTSVSVSLGRWLSGRLRDTYARAEAELKTTFDKRIAKRAEAVAEDDYPAQQRFCDLFGFHSRTTPMQLRLAGHYAARGAFNRAEQILLSESKRPDGTVAATALARLAEMLRKRGLPRDANVWYRRLETQFPNGKLADGQTVGQFLTELRRTGVSTENVPRTPISWGAHKMVLQPSGTRYTSNSIRELRIASGRAPYFRGHRFQSDSSQQQLTIVDSESNTLKWLVPLRSHAGGASSTATAAAAAEHSLFVLHRGVIHCLSPVDRRILWTRPLEVRGGSSAVRSSFDGIGISYGSASSRQLDMLWSPRAALSRYAVYRKSTFSPVVPIANGRYLGAYGRRKFTVIDAMTGETMWEFDKLPPGARIVGAQNMLYVVPREGVGYALRAVDGKRIDVKDVEKFIVDTIDVVGDDLLRLEVKTASFLGFTRESLKLRLMDPLTGKDRWSRQFKSGTQLSRADDGSLIVLSKEGNLEIINPEDGSVISRAQLARNDVRSSSNVYVIADRDSLLLVINSRNRAGRTYYSSGIATVVASGQIIAFDRSSGKQLWKQKVTNRNLVVQYLAHSPVLTFTSRKYIRRGRTSYQSMKMMVIDKRTGDRLIDVETPTNQYYRALRLNVPKRYVEFESYNHRLRLQVVEGKPAKQPANKQTAARTAGKGT